MTDRHADFEALSAYVDGEAPEWADHVEACAPCRATAAELRALAVAVAAPVAARSAADVERDIAAALDAVPTSTAPAPESARPAPRRRSGNPWALGAVAAVVLAVVGFSGLVLSSNRQSGNSTTVAGPAFQSEANLDARTGPEAAGGVAGAAPSLPPSDLGDVGDAATLRSRAQPGVTTGAGGAGAAGNSATSGRSSSSSNSGAASNPPIASGGSSGAAATAGGLTPTTTLNQGAGATVVGTRPCEEQARTREPNLGPVVYFATARQGAVAGFVLGFGPAPGSAPGPVTLLLLAQDGCAELLRSVGP